MGIISSNMKQGSNQDFMKCSNSLFNTAQMKCVAAFFQIKGQSILIQMYSDFFGGVDCTQTSAVFGTQFSASFFFRFPGVQGPFDFEFQTLRSMAVGHFHVNLRSSKTTSVAGWSSLCHCWEWALCEILLNKNSSWTTETTKMSWIW